MAAAILQVNLKKCPHFAGIKTLSSYPHSLTMSHLWQNYHHAAEKGTTVTVTGQSGEGKKSSCFQEFISKTHSLLSNNKDRVSGLILLDELVQQCNTETYHQHSPTWLKLLLQILQRKIPNWSSQFINSLLEGIEKKGHAKQSVHRAACRIIGAILRFSKHFTDLSREIVSTTLPQLVSALLGCSSEWKAAAMSCLTVCLQTFSGTMVTYKNKIETFALHEIELQCCSKEATDCLCLLVQCGGGGNQGIKYSENWSELCDKLLGSLEETLSQLYDGVETGASTSEARQTLALKTISTSQTDKLSLLIHRWKVLCDWLKTLLGTELNAVAKIPADHIIKLVCRCLSTNTKMLLSRPTAERTSLALHLPTIHIAALKVLKQIIFTCGTLLVPYCRVVMGYISQELLWTHWSDNQTEKPYGALRTCTYEVLTAWLKVMDGCSGFLYEEKGIVKELIHDLTPQKNTLKLDKSVTTTMNGDGPPVKKHKGGNYEVSQGISSQRKVHNNANGSLVTASLEALYWIVTITGPELDRKSMQDTQEFVIKSVLLLHQSSSPLVPYGNPECRRLLYRVLLACALTPHPSAPPPLHCAVSCLSVGLQDKDFEVSSFCKEALRTAESLIHPRVPCLNGPVVCGNLISLSTTVSNNTAVKMPNFTIKLGNHTPKPSSITIQKAKKEVSEQFRNGPKSLVDLDDGSMARKRGIISISDDEEPGKKREKVEVFGSPRILSENRNKLDTLQPSTSEAMQEFGCPRIVGENRNVADSPQPSSSKALTIEIDSDDDSDSVEEVGVDLSDSSTEDMLTRGYINHMAKSLDVKRKELMNSLSVHNEETDVNTENIEYLEEMENDDNIEEVGKARSRAESSDSFITTDIEGQKEVLIAVPFTEDKEEIQERILQKKSEVNTDDVNGKNADPKIDAILSTFVDADPDSE